MKTMNSSVSRCLKVDFKAFEKRSDNTFMLSWGMEGETERVSEYNEETGELKYTGEVIETDYCTYESGLYKGILNPIKLDESLLNVNRKPSLVEYKAIYDGMELGDEEQLALLKVKLKAKASLYGSSEEVDDFTIGGIHIWLNHDLRGKVKENLETSQQLGETETVLRFNGMAFPMTVEQGWQMYYAVLAYARECWNTTEIHLSAIDALQTVDELLAYDYKSGYPQKLAF